MQISEVYAVEVRQFTGGDMKTLVPRVLNASLLQADRRAVATGRGETWTAERFYADLLERRGEEAVNVFRTIHRWAEAQSALAVFFGSGKSDGSVQMTYKYGDDRSVYQRGDTVILTLWSYGWAEVEFQYLAAREVFASAEVRDERRRRLMAGSTLNVPVDKIAKRPSFFWSELSDSGNVRCLESAMEWVISVLQSAGRPEVRNG